MNGERTEAAVRRIEAALARISAAADDLRPSASAVSPSVSALVQRHETLREDVAGTLRELDALIERLEG